MDTKNKNLHLLQKLAHMNVLRHYILEAHTFPQYLLSQNCSSRAESESSEMSLHILIPNRGYCFNNSIFGKSLKKLLCPWQI